MRESEEIKLDNPVYFSLQETHRSFSIGYSNLLFYNPLYCPFGGFAIDFQLAADMDQYAQEINDFFVVGSKPGFNQGIVLCDELVCLQMILRANIETSISSEIILLNGKHEEALFDLVNHVQPGYFKNKTSELGAYYGIFKNEQLVAVTGERMKMDLFTEVSAVVTHPDHTGNGYAKQLITHTANEIFLQNKIPYLHVAESNVTAIGLYKKLGFEIRRRISFWHFLTQAKVKVGK